MADRSIVASFTGDITDFVTTVSDLQHYLDENAEAIDRALWMNDVAERLHSAIYAIERRYEWQWENPGVYGVPGLPECVQVRYREVTDA